MTAFNLSCVALSIIATSSAFCSAVLSLGDEGQSILATDAIQAARNSRVGAGGCTFEGTYVAPCETTPVANPKISAPMKVPRPNQGPPTPTPETRCAPTT